MQGFDDRFTILVHLLEGEFVYIAFPRVTECKASRAVLNIFQNDRVRQLRINRHTLNRVVDVSDQVAFIIEDIDNCPFFNIFVATVANHGSSLNVEVACA